MCPPNEQVTVTWKNHVQIVMQMGQQKFEGAETITRRKPADLRGIPKGSVVHFDREIVGEGMWSVVRERIPVQRLADAAGGAPDARAFRKQSLQHMQDFKVFTEQGKDDRAAKD